MIRISKTARDTIFYSGWAALIAGAAIFYFALERFDTFPNYKRISVLIPMAIGWVLLCVDDFREWPSTSRNERLKSVSAVLVLLVLVAGSLAWWFGAPNTHG